MRSSQLRYAPYVSKFDKELMSRASDDEVDIMAMWDIEADDWGIMP